MISKVRKQPRESNRVTKQDWVVAAEKELATRGIDAVRVEPLAKNLGITKGSFYWHFEDRRALLMAVLNNWRRRATNAIIKRLDDSELSALERLYELFLLPKRGSKALEGANLETAIRQWAKTDDLAQQAVDEVDEHRMHFLCRTYRGMGFDEETAHAKAFFFYCQLQGMANISNLGTDAIMTTGKRLLAQEAEFVMSIQHS